MPSLAPFAMWVTSRRDGAVTGSGSIIYTGTNGRTYCTRPAAGYTLSDVPTITNTSACDACSAAADIMGTASPKNTMKGRSNEPSPARVPGFTSQLSGPSSTCQRGSSGSRLEHTFVSSPCRCITLDDPARSWRLSTFCVITVTSYILSRLCMSLCPSLGCAP
ncbi:unknown [Prevotella sp. CAG:487]|nr:unknown [Prevotella sp. CAG:487]